MNCQCIKIESINENTVDLLKAELEKDKELLYFDKNYKSDSSIIK